VTELLPLLPMAGVDVVAGPMAPLFGPGLRDEVEDAELLGEVGRMSEKALFFLLADMC